jgi:hypothetical protein
MAKALYTSSYQHRQQLLLRHQDRPRQLEHKECLVKEM